MSNPANAVHDERWAWDRRLPLSSRGPVLYPGSEPWKAAALAQCERCVGPCEAEPQGEHYHPVSDGPKGE